MSDVTANTHGKLLSRIGALEVLMQNLYARYYMNHYDSPSLEADKSLINAIARDYHLSTMSGDLESSLKSDIEELIIDFFGNNLSIVSAMERFQAHTDTTASATEIWKEFFTQHYADYSIVEVSGVEVPSSDVVRRVWIEANDGARQSFVVKELGENDKRNQMVKQYGLFDREMCFYQLIAPHQSIAVPKLLHYSIDPPYLILEDVGRYIPGCQEFGYTIPEAKSVIDHISAFHGRWLNTNQACALPVPRVNHPLIKQELPRVLQQIWRDVGGTFRDYVGDDADLYVTYLVEHINDITDVLAADHMTVLHGDLRLDNILFNKYEAQYFVDWQLLAVGSPMMDVAYFISQSGTPACQEEVKEYAFNLYADKIYGNAFDVMKREYFNALILNLSTPVFALYSDMGGENHVYDIALQAFKRAIDHIKSGMFLGEMTT